MQKKPITYPAQLLVPILNHILEYGIEIENWNRSNSKPFPIWNPESFPNSIPDLKMMAPFWFVNLKIH